MGSETQHPCLPPPKDPKDFLPRMWVVERYLLLALGHDRRTSKDYERLCETSEAFVCVATTRPMARRSARAARRFRLRPNLYRTLTEHCEAFTGAWDTGEGPTDGGRFGPWPRQRARVRASFRKRAFCQRFALHLVRRQPGQESEILEEDTDHGVG